MVLLAGNIEFHRRLHRACRLRSGGAADVHGAGQDLAHPGRAPARWRQLVVVLAVSLLVTLPWLYLWPEWFDYLLRRPWAVGANQTS